MKLFLEGAEKVIKGGCKELQSTHAPDAIERRVQKESERWDREWDADQTESKKNTRRGGAGDGMPILNTKQSACATGSPGQQNHSSQLLTQLFQQFNSYIKSERLVSLGSTNHHIPIDIRYHFL